LASVARSPSFCRWKIVSRSNARPNCGASTNALALAIVRTVVREQLIDAVLDDGEAVANDGIG